MLGAGFAVFGDAVGDAVMVEVLGTSRVVIRAGCICVGKGGTGLLLVGAIWLEEKSETVLFIGRGLMVVA